MNIPGFTAEQTLHTGRAYRQSRGTRQGLRTNRGGVVPQFSCQTECVDDAREIYHDCIIECDDNSLCYSRCGIAYNNYVAKCIASCPKL
jgi:hypothetical protein